MSSSSPSDSVKDMATVDVEFRRFSVNILQIIKGQSKLLEKLKENGNISSNMLTILKDQNALLAKLEKNLRTATDYLCNQVDSSSSDKDVLALVESMESLRSKDEESTVGNIEADYRPKIAKFSKVSKFENPDHNPPVVDERNFYPESVLCSVQFDGDQSIEKLTLNLVWSLRYVPLIGLRWYNFMANIYSDGTKSNETMMGRRDYFILLDVMKTSNPIRKWFLISIQNGKSDGSLSSDPGHKNFTEEFLTEQEFLPYLPEVTLEVTVIVKYYDPDSSISGTTMPKPHRSTPEERMTKLINLRGQLNSEIVFKSDDDGANGSVAINTAILEDYSPVFQTMFDSASKPESNNVQQEICIPYLSIESMNNFYKWIYGTSDGEWLDNVQINLELLKFAHEYMILELIDVCTENLVKTPDESYTIELVYETGKFAETYEIPELQDRVFEWIKTKSARKSNSGGGCLVA